MGRFVRNKKTENRAAADAIRRRNVAEARQAEQDREDERQREWQRLAQLPKLKPLPTPLEVFPGLVEQALALLDMLDYPDGTLIQVPGTWRNFWREQTHAIWEIKRHENVIVRTVQGDNLYDGYVCAYHLVSTGEILVRSGRHSASSADDVYSRRLSTKPRVGWGGWHTVDIRGAAFSEVEHWVPGGTTKTNLLTLINEGLRKLIDNLERKAQR